VSSELGSPGWVDTHCHLDDPAYDNDRDAVVLRAERAGVHRVVVPGVSPASWDRARRCRDRHPNLIRLAFGLHPWALRGLNAADRFWALDALPQALDDGAIAVGECGLDGRIAREGGPSLAEQAVILSDQLDLARERGLPVILHAVRAHGALLTLLRSRDGPVPGVLHSYSGPAELVPDFVRLGLYLSFGGQVTNPEATKVHKAVRVTPAARLVVESDGPDQPPFPRITQRSEPADVARLAGVMATLRGGAWADPAAALFGSALLG
jgi:TatD DNase family protein